MERTSIAFTASDGTTLRGWLYKPLHQGDGLPAIAMSHGFAALKEHSLDRFAKYFCKKDFVVLVWDNRHFGASGGEPRQHIDVVMQRRDYRDAITFLSEQHFVDPERIGIWGTSLSGSNVLAVAAQDRRVRAVVAMTPATQFWRRRQQYLLPAETGKLESQLLKDRRKRFNGADYSTMQVIDPENGRAAFGKDPHAARFYQSVTEWQNSITIASFDSIVEYDVENLIHQIGPTPLLTIATQDDQLVPIATQLMTHAKALEPKELLLLKGEHFSVYNEDENLEAAREAAAKWFKHWL